MARKTGQVKAVKKELKSSIVNINYHDVSLVILPDMNEYFTKLLKDSRFYYEHIKDNLINPMFDILDELIAQVTSGAPEIQYEKVKLLKKSELYANYKSNIFYLHQRDIIGDKKKALLEVDSIYFHNTTTIITYWCFLKEITTSIVKSGEKFTKLLQLKQLMWRIERLLVQFEMAEVWDGTIDWSWRTC